jgi:hypothetical protein
MNDFQVRMAPLEKSHPICKTALIGGMSFCFDELFQIYFTFWGYCFLNVANRNIIYVFVLLGYPMAYFDTMLDGLFQPFRSPFAFRTKQARVLLSISSTIVWGFKMLI